MKTLEEQYIKDRHGNIAEANVRENDEDTTLVPMKMTLSWVLTRLCNSYSPHSELTLQINEIRHLHKVLDVIDNKELKIGDKMEFEDEHFKVLKKLAISILPTVVFVPILMAAPQIEDILNKAESEQTKK